MHPGREKKPERALLKCDWREKEWERQSIGGIKMTEMTLGFSQFHLETSQWVGRGLGE